jgi:hypothetical protein
MAGDGRPRHCGRRAGEARPQGPYAYLPRGGICDNGEPRSRRPVAAGSPPGHPAHRAAGQWRSRSDAASPPGPVPARGGAGPDRGPGALQIAGTRPEGEGRPRGKRPLPGKRRTCRVCYTPPASAATARGDVAAGRRGRIADMTTLMLPADLAAVSSLPLVGQRAAPADYALRGRWRVRRSRAARNSRFWCLSYAGLLLHRLHCLRCSGRLADSCRETRHPPGRPSRSRTVIVATAATSGRRRPLADGVRTHTASDVFVILKAGRPPWGIPSRKSIAVEHRSVPR